MIASKLIDLESCFS